MKALIRKTYWLISSQFGFDPKRLLLSLRGIPRYLIDGWSFGSGYQGKLSIRPCLHDRYQEGGSTKDEYFIQDLQVARWIYQANPVKHVDIGSRIDGFVTHVASFREIEVFDIRPVSSTIPGIHFKQADLMKSSQSWNNYCDSLSCLHALEHFGLGRYGDPIDPMGYQSGLNNMANILQSGGLFYLSVPIGIERVEFNAQRIVDPINLNKLATSYGLTLKNFNWLDSNGLLVESTQIEYDLKRLAQEDYTLGIFTFIKQ